MRVFLIALVLLAPGLHAEDEQRVVSPDGQLDFRLFTGQPDGALWPRLGYQVTFHGKQVLAPSWLGLDIRDQEPFLGENPGFMYADKGSDEKAHCNFLIAHYMQNGSLGRRLDVEIRAYDDGVAFRYVIPKSTQTVEVLIRSEQTQFNFAEPGALDKLAVKPDYDLPFTVEAPGSGYIEIADAGREAKAAEYPRTYLVHSSASGMLTSLSRSVSDPTVAFTALTPLNWPWRVILIGPDRERLVQSDTIRKLNR